MKICKNHGVPSLSCFLSRQTKIILITPIIERHGKIQKPNTRTSNGEENEEETKKICLLYVNFNQLTRFRIHVVFASLDLPVHNGGLHEQLLRALIF